MFRTIIAALLTTLLLNSAPVEAGSLSVDQIQNAWKNQGNISGRFTTQFPDGSQTSGNFTIFGPAKMVLNYPATNAQLVFEGHLARHIDTEYSANSQTRSDQRLALIFSTNPRFAQYANRTGANPEVTMLQFSGNEGTIKMYFSNATGRLTMLSVQNSGDRRPSVTKFSY